METSNYFRIILFQQNNLYRSIYKNFCFILQCSCSGYAKRRVQCFDMKLNKQSNYCIEKNKPEQKRRCDQPANCK